MHSLSIVHEIDRLLNEGQLSQREIARRLRVSRGTVSAIANGERGLYGRSAGDTDSPAAERDQLPERCPKCGFLVHLPCLVCRTREYRQGRQALAKLAARRPASLRCPRRMSLGRRRRGIPSRVA
jgi:hypothetical protein